jgi:2-polyprenyl-6-methoxyphenol hydroxylase-like FAD-dependent oxidoreductase
VTVRLQDGREERGDVLIGADGLRSTLRASLPGATAPRYAGYVSWQAIARVDTDVVPVGLFRVIWGRGARFLFYRIGPEEVYWEGTFAAAAGGEGRPRAAQAGRCSRAFAAGRHPSRRSSRRARTRRSAAPTCTTGRPRSSGAWGA